MSHLTSQKCDHLTINVHGSEVCSPGQHFDLLGTDLYTRDTAVSTVGKISALILRGRHKQYTMNTLAAAVNTMVIV